MAEKLEFRFDLLKGQTTVIEALDEASKKATGFKAIIGEAGEGTSFLKLAGAVAVGQAAFEFAKEAASKFIDVLGEGITAAIEKENAINKLNISLAQTGKYSETASEDIQAFAEQMRKTTKYTDDQILSNAAYLQSLTYLDTKGLKKATQASADLASTLGIDLNSATTLVAKSIEGNTGALQRYGIQVKKGADDTENFTNTMRALSQFSGRAAADSNTFGGAIIKTKNALDEVYAALGQIVTKNPVIITIIKEFGEGFNSLSESIKNNQNDIINFVNGALKVLGEGLIKFSSYVEFAATNMTSILSVVRMIIQGWSLLLQELSGLQFITEIVGRFVTGLLEIPKGITQLIQYIAELASSSTMLKSAFDKAGISLDDVNKEYDKLTNKIEDLQVEVAAVDFDKSTVKALNTMDSLIGKSQDFMKDQVKSVEDIGKKIINTSQITLENQKEVIRNNQQIYMESDNFFQRIGKSFSSFSAIGNKLSDIFTKIDRSTGLTKFGEALDKLGPEMIGNISKGVEGLRSTMTSTVKAVGNMFANGLGDVVAPIFDMFTKGPEFTKAMVKGFIEGIPTIIENIIMSIPALIEALSEALPNVLVRLAIMFGTPGFYLKVAEGLLKAVAGIPKNIANAIIDGLKSLPKQLGAGILAEIPKIIAKFLEGAVQFVAKIVEGAGSFVWTIISGAASFVGEILSGAVDFVGKIIEGAGRFIEELISKIPVVGGIFGGGGGGGGIIGEVGGFIEDVFDWNKGGRVDPVYAAQGMMIPFQPKGTDTVPSMLTPGEYVVDRSTTQKLNNFLDNQSQVGRSEGLLNQILTELRKPQTISSEISLNKKTFADLILELNRSNARLA